MEQKLIIKPWFAKKEGLPLVMTGVVERETAKAVLFSGNATMDAEVGCIKCGRELTHPVSRLVGIGPECGKHFHIPIAALGVDELTDEHLAQLRAMVTDIKVENVWIPKSAIKWHSANEMGRTVQTYVLEDEDAKPAEPQYRVVTRDGRIYFKSKFVENTQAKGVAGYKWETEWKCWSYPANARVATALAAFVPEDEIHPGVVALVREHASVMAAAAAAKVSEDLEQPRLTKTKAWTHQCQAYHFLYNLPAGALFMEMGTGKSKVTVDLVVNRGHRRTLIICPKSVIPVWPKEFAVHGGAPVHVVTLEGTPAQKVKALHDGCKMLDAQVVFVCNYESVWRDPLAAELEKAKLDLVVLDEAHKIKSPGSRVSLFLSGLGKKVPHRLILTGTPMANSPLDVYGQYRFLDPTIFGTNYKRFEDRYAVKGGFNDYTVIGYKNQEELAAKMYEVAFRVRSADVLDLPPTTHVTRYTELGSSARAIYRKLAKDFVVEFGGSDGDVSTTTQLAITKLLRLQQITSGHLPDDEGVVHQIDTSKEDLLDEVLEDIDRSEPVVVFTRFVHDAAAVRRVAERQGRRVAELSGSKNELATFQAGDADLIVVNIQSGGAGIDLTRAAYAIYYSVGHSLGTYEQSLARTHRPGQTRHVTYIHLVVRATVDVEVRQALEDKTDIVRYFIETLKQ